MNLRTKLFAIMFVCAMLTSLLNLPYSMASSNIVKNGDFENGLQDWNSFYVEMMEENGNHYLKFFRPPSPWDPSTPYNYISQVIHLSVGANYFAIKHKHDGISFSVVLMTVPIPTSILHFDVDGSYLKSSGTNFVFDRQLGDGWRETCVVLYMNEEKSAIMRMGIVSCGSQEAYLPMEVYVDDVYLGTESPSPPIPWELLAISIVAVALIAVYASKRKKK